MGSKLTAPVQPLEVTLRNDMTLWLRDQAANTPAARVTREELVARILRQAGDSRSSRWSSPPTRTRATKTCWACSIFCSATA